MKPRSSFISSKECASLYGLNRSTLRSLVARKEIPHIRVTPNLVVFDPDELDRWIKRIPAQSR